MENKNAWNPTIELTKGREENEDKSIVKPFNSISGRQGALLNVSYEEMVAKFGENQCPEGHYWDGKVDVSFFVFIETQPIWFWNYKDGPSYIDGAKIEDISRWSFGSLAGFVTVENYLKNIFPQAEITK